MKTCFYYIDTRSNVCSGMWKKSTTPDSGEDKPGFLFSDFCVYFSYVAPNQYAS